MFHPFEIDERVLVRVQFEDLIEERTAGTEDHLVALDLLVVLSDQTEVAELQVVVLPLEGLTSTLVKLLPDQFVAL